VPELAVADPNAETLPSDDSSPPSTASDALVGRTLGHFRVGARLGRGGMGAVYRAWDASLEREVAVKVLIGEVAGSERRRDGDASAQARFLREARVQAKLRHPNVVPIHFVGQEGDVSFLVMDVVDGESLAGVLAREGVLGESRALDVADAIAAALDAGSAAGLVHRDVKPSNILVQRDGRVMLADFGLAKTIDHAPIAREGGASESSALTHAGSILGTPAYLAPEQARGEPVDFRADMYSLGVTLYEALTGQPPFTGENASALLRQHVSEAPIAPRVLAPTLRPAVESLVMRLLAKDPAARFSSYAELRAAIDAAREKPTAPATFFVRAVAFAIDLAVLGTYAAILGEMLHVAALGWLIGALQFVALERVWSTPGKKLMRLRVVDEKGDVPSWKRSLLRSVVRASGPIVMALDLDVLGQTGVVESLIFVFALFGWTVVVLLKLQDRMARTREVFV